MFSILKFVFVIILAGSSLASSADVQVGVSTPSTMHGRTVVAGHIAYSGNSMAASFFTSGVRTSAYYHNAYQVGAFRTLGEKPLLWGKFQPAFGLGILYSVRVYRKDSEDPSKDTIRREVTVGPALRNLWFVAGPLFVGVEVLAGLSWANIYLDFRHSSHLIVGVDL